MEDDADMLRMCLSRQKQRQGLSPQNSTAMLTQGVRAWGMPYPATRIGCVTPFPSQHPSYIEMTLELRLI